MGWSGFGPTPESLGSSRAQVGFIGDLDGPAQTPAVKLIRKFSGSPESIRNALYS